MRRFSGICVVLALLLLAPVAPVSAERTSSTTAKTVVEVRTFGRSVKGLPLKAYRLGDPTSTNKAVIIATMHGNEPGPARILKNLIGGKPLAGADVWVIPDLNPDGYVRNRRQNAHGVDLNRNFPIGWVHRTGSYYSGPHAYSEPETQALMRFLGEVRPGAVISFHQPLHGVDTSYGKAHDLAVKLVNGLGLPAKVFNCTSGCHGTMTEWFNWKFPGAALTVEYGSPMTDQQVFRTGPAGLISAVGATR